MSFTAKNKKNLVEVDSTRFFHISIISFTLFRDPGRTFALFINSGKIQVRYGNKTIQDPDSYLVFHSPDLTYSFAHNNALEGYVIYFTPERFSFFKPEFHPQLPFFDRLHTNLFKFDHASFEQQQPHFETVFTAYEQSAKTRPLEARVKLLGLLYHLQDFARIW